MDRPALPVVVAWRSLIAAPTVALGALAGAALRALRQT
ncbi:hypothetical protein MBEHAL_0137 [Halarchaeum acidiphilum MH1-52-1]|uniref:Uncharacterized protein n=1 Tax=Halarchaeum acidiphilum MH1-52-1 TaxID=1261545 RepID=U2YRN9_9EURY|nr:hypothetical protein MBEHAL_0137 [Halarchaeum acidiphilum MH1-52-1]